MRRLVTVTLLAVMVMVAVVLLQPTPVQAAGGSCPKTNPVSCYNCNGTFAYCARSHAFCPECPAP